MQLEKTAHLQTSNDHIYCNEEANISSNKISEIGLSDHFPIFLTGKTNSKSPKFSHHTITYRSFKTHNEQDFNMNLKLHHGILSEFLTTQIKL